MTHRTALDKRKGKCAAMTNTDYLTQPIRTEADYQAALQLVAPYFENEPEIGSDAAMHFEAMIKAIQAYEAKHYQ